MTKTRREFIQDGVLALGSGLLTTASLPRISMADDKKNENKTGVEEVSPVEDLMREHGGLNRILLIYEEVLRRMESKKDFNPKLLKNCAQLIHNFIENYHEKLEEEYLFPRFKKANKFVDLVDTLTAQHRAGRKLTDTILTLSTQAHLKNEADSKTLSNVLRQFIHMYRPHEAREDTILFPEFKKLLTPKEYDRLGDQFEDREHELFGKEGFDGIIVEISSIEKLLGIYDLNQFTPTSGSA